MKFCSLHSSVKQMQSFIFRFNCGFNLSFCGMFGEAPSSVDFCRILRREGGYLSEIQGIRVGKCLLINVQDKISDFSTLI